MKLELESRVQALPPLAAWLGLLSLNAVCYLLLVALSPLKGLHLSNTPLSTQWSWTLIPGNLFYSFGVDSTGRDAHLPWLAPFLLFLLLLGLLAAYASAAIIARHYQPSPGRRYLSLLLAGALLFSLILLFQPLLFSDDVFTYMMSGRILSVYGSDPLNTVPSLFTNDPYLRWVISDRNQPTIYGALWICITALLASISNEPAISLLLFKSFMLLTHLLNSVLIWIILGKVAPERQLTGTLLYAWNPLAVIELAGNGHSEGLLLSLLLLATLVALQENRLSHIIAGLIFGLAISMNFIALLLAPLYIWFCVRDEERLARAGLRFCAYMLLMLTPPLCLLLPFWSGSSTFFAITSAVDLEHFVHSPTGLLAEPTRLLFQRIVEIGHLSPTTPPTVAADRTIRTSALFIFTLIYIHLFNTLRKAPLTRAGMVISPGDDPQRKQSGVDVLFTSWSSAIFSYIILVSGWFWPEYVLWMLWVVVLRRVDALSLALLLLSGTALFIYPLVGFRPEPLAMYQIALIFGIPLVYMTIASIRQRRAERMNASYEG